MAELITQIVQDLEDAAALGANFLTDVCKLIQTIGYTLTDADEWLIGFCVQKIEQEIKNACNISEVPDGLYHCAVGLVVADFLTIKRGNGNLNVESLTFDPAIKQIKEGDTEITYAVDSVASGEQRFNLFLNACYQGREQFIAYRRIKW